MSYTIRAFDGQKRLSTCVVLRDGSVMQVHPKEEGKPVNFQDVDAWKASVESQYPVIIYSNDPNYLQNMEFVPEYAAAVKKEVARQTAKATKAKKPREKQEHSDFYKEWKRQENIKKYYWESYNLAAKVEARLREERAAYWSKVREAVAKGEDPHSVPINPIHYWSCPYCHRAEDVGHSGCVAYAYDYSIEDWMKAGGL